MSTSEPREFSAATSRFAYAQAFASPPSHRRSGAPDRVAESDHAERTDRPARGRDLRHVLAGRRARRGA